MNRFDVFLLTMVVVLLVLGAWKGFVRLLLGTAGLIVGVFLALRFESAQPGESFADIASEVNYGNVDLVRRDAFESERLSTKAITIQ